MYNEYNDCIDCASCTKRYPETWQEPHIGFDMAPAEMYSFCSTMECQNKNTIAYTFKSIEKDLEDWNVPPTSFMDPKAPRLVNPSPLTIRSRRLQMLTAEENQILITTTEYSPKPVIKKFIEILQKLYDGGCFDKEEITPFGFGSPSYVYNPYPAVQPHYPRYDVPFGSNTTQPITPVTDNKETTTVTLTPVEKDDKAETKKTKTKKTKTKTEDSITTLDQLYNSLDEEKEPEIK